MRHALTAVLAITVIASTVAPALADGRPPGSTEPNLPDPPAKTRTERYGTHILLADLAVFAATFVVAEAESSSEDGGSGIGALVSLGYFAAGPLVHLHHGNPSGARKSIAARALMPIGGALIGMALVGASRDDSDENDGLGGLDVVIGMALGATAGGLTAMVLDWTVFSKKTVEVKPSGLAVAPSVGATRHSVSVGLAGRF